MVAKSCPSGAPTAADAARAAVTPGTVSISTPGASAASSSAIEAMAYTPGSPEHTSATSRPPAASASACLARTTSSPIGLRTTS